ncbi:MAG TPA: thioredoxin domain-containing protein, partial [Flavisolibacter sp.]|nr:thioredoxin domain-containing protein [Flavisolibacter sp.]
KEVVEIIEPKDVFVGNPDAPVTLMEFGEYESEACARANEVVKQLLDTYEGKIRFNFRHFPLTRIHQRALKAAEAAVATAQDGKFWEMHNAIFANRRHLGVFNLKTYAREVGITNKKFLDDLMNGVYGLYVQADLKEGIKLGVNSVPVFFINGKRFEQEPTFKNLSAYIKALPDAKKEKVKNITEAAPKKKSA